MSTNQRNGLRSFVSEPLDDGSCPLNAATVNNPHQEPEGHDQSNAEPRGVKPGADGGAARPVMAIGGSGRRRRGIPGEEDTMLQKHAHPPGRFDPGHCRDCAREADLLDHYLQVQREEQAFTEAHRWARRAYRHASWALWCSGIGIVLAVIAVLTG